MIDLDILEFSLGVAESSGDKTTAIYCASLRELITRLREAEKDAARYRWLCNQHWFESEAEWNMPINLHAEDYEFNKSVGVAIDQSIKEKSDE